MDKDNKTKVTLIYLGRRGAGPMYALEMAKALATKVTIQCFISKNIENYDLWKAEQNKKFLITFIPTYKSFIEFCWQSCCVTRYIRIIAKINNFNPDIVYSPMGHFWERFIIPYLKCKCKIQTVHDVILHVGENSWKHQLIKKIFSYKTDKYIILSQIFKTVLLKSGIKEQNIAVIPHATFGIYNDKNQEVDIKTYFRFLFFGRIIKYKGIEVLLQAMENITKKIPEMKLIIVGDGEIEEYKKLLEKYKHNIELHIGWIDDSKVKDYFKDIDFVILPYTHASQSGVIPLAHSFGKPVIATRVGGLPEQVLEGETGLLIPPNDSLELSNSVVTIMKNDIILKSMKLASWKYANSNTWNSSADTLLSFAKMNTKILCKN